MLREGDIKNLTWAEKTMSVLQEQKLAACDNRLARLPEISLFDLEDDVRTEDVWHISFDAEENPRPVMLHSASKLRQEILKSLPFEASLLSVKEFELARRILEEGGEAWLRDWEEVEPAEALIRRLWCKTFTGDDGTVYLSFPDEVRDKLLSCMEGNAFKTIRRRLEAFDRIMREKLYISGILPADDAVKHLREKVAPGLKDRYPQFFTRFLKTSYDYTVGKGGRLYLLHRGAADIDRLLPLAEKAQPYGDAAEGMENDYLPVDILADELQIVMPLMIEISDAVRPELLQKGPMVAVDDLRMLVKQGVSWPELREVFASMLMVKPTERMLESVLRLYRFTPRWCSMPTAMVQ